MEQVGYPGKIVVSEENWLMKAYALTRGEREKSYGSPLLNFLRTGLRWSLRRNIIFTPVDVLEMMVDVKTAREEETHMADNFIDRMGYLDCYQRIDDHMRTLGYANGAEAFKKMSLDDLNNLRLLLETTKAYGNTYNGGD